MTESERIALPLIEKLIVYRDTLKSREDRELLADACNTISSLRATCTTLRARLALLESVLAEAGEVIELAIPELQKWEFVESKTYSYGDGRTEPFEWGIDVHYQQQKPHDTPEYMFRADVQTFQANADYEEWDSLSRRASTVSAKIVAMDAQENGK